MSGQACPVCGGAVPVSPRYPDHLCHPCARRATDAAGRPLRFNNLSFSGGYIAHYADSAELYDSHECFVDGHRCKADEAYMGGIVLRPWNEARDGPVSA